MTGNIVNVAKKNLKKTTCATDKVCPAAFIIVVGDADNLMHEEPRDADGERPDWRSCTISGGRSKRDDQRFLFLRPLQRSINTVDVLVLSGARR